MGKIMLGLAVIVAASGGCATTTKHATSSVTTSPSPTLATAPSQTVPATSPPTVAPTPATTGSTIGVSDGNGKTADVTLTKVTDPATGADQFTSPDPGKRFVAATIEIMNTTAGTTLTGDADSDLTLIGSDDQDYTADFSDVVGCTNFNDGEYTIAPGQALTGCVTFQLPTSVTPAKAQFALTSFGGTDGQWAIGSTA